MKTYRNRLLERWAISGASSGTIFANLCDQTPTGPRGHRQAVICVAFHPDGRQPRGLGGSDGDVRVWDLSARMPIKVFNGSGQIRCVAVSPDGYTSDAGGGLWLGEPGTGREREAFGHREASGLLAFSPDSRHLRFAESAGLIVQWDVETGKNATELRHHHQEEGTPGAPSRSARRPLAHDRNLQSRRASHRSAGAGPGEDLGCRHVSTPRSGHGRRCPRGIVDPPRPRICPGLTSRGERGSSTCRGLTSPTGPCGSASTHVVVVAFSPLGERSRWPAENGRAGLFDVLAVFRPVPAGQLFAVLLAFGAEDTSWRWPVDEIHVIHLARNLDGKTAAASLVDPPAWRGQFLDERLLAGPRRRHDRRVGHARGPGSANAEWAWTGGLRRGFRTRAWRATGLGGRRRTDQDLGCRGRRPTLFPPVGGAGAVYTGLCSA